MAELLRIHQVERVRRSHGRFVHGLENLGSMASGNRWPSVNIAKRTRWRGPQAGNAYTHVNTTGPRSANEISRGDMEESYGATVELPLAQMTDSEHD
jgi:hypothetical protein